MPLFGPPNIGELERKRNVGGLIKALNYKKDSQVRWRAAKALGKMGDARAVEPLAAALRDADENVCIAAAKALGQIGDARAVEALIAALKDTAPLVQEAAAEALVKIGDARAVEALIAALKDADWRVRRAAAKALGKIGDARAVEPLVAALKDREESVRGAAAQALGQIGDARAVEPLAAAPEATAPKASSPQPTSTPAKQSPPDPKVGGKALSQRLVDNGDGTLTDHVTGLMWQKDDDGIERNFDDAAAYCHGLTLAGHYDWRLPTLAEFGSLVEAAKGSGLQVNTTYNRSSNDDYWTGTPGPQSNVANIADGTTMFRTNTYCVRAVRLKKSSASLPRMRNEMDRWPRIVEKGAVNPNKETKVTYTMTEASRGSPVSIEAATEQYCVYCKRFNDPEFRDPAFPGGGGYCGFWNGAVGMKDSCIHFEPDAKVRYWLSKGYMLNNRSGYPSIPSYQVFDDGNNGA